LAVWNNIRNCRHPRAVVLMSGCSIRDLRQAWHMRWLDQTVGQIPDGLDHPQTETPHSFGKGSARRIAVTSAARMAQTRGTL
jgi:hypothetical protein